MTPAQLRRLERALGRGAYAYGYAEDYWRVNLIGALRVSARKRKIKLHIHAYRHLLTGDEVVIFLEHLLRRISGPIVLVWDQHPIHRRWKVQDFLARHPRLHLYEFPTGAPELNPAEGIWTHSGTIIPNATVFRSDDDCGRKPAFGMKVSRHFDW